MKNKLFRLLFEGSFRRQLIITVALVHAVMMFLFVVDLIHRQRTTLMEHQIEDVEGLAMSMATSSAGWVAANDIAVLQELVNAQRRYPDLLFMMLTDIHGKVLAHSETDKLGIMVADMPTTASPAILWRTQELVDVAAPVMLNERHVGWVQVGLGQQQALKKLDAIVRDGMIYAVIAILAGSVFAWLMGRRITNRIYAIQAVIDNVKAGDRESRCRLE